MSSDSLPSYISYILYAVIVLLSVLNAVTAASKRSLDYADRNAIKEMLEDEPDNARFNAIIEFKNKPSRYHYADHMMTYILSIAAFIIFNFTVLFTAGLYNSGNVKWLYLILANLGFAIIYTALCDVLPKKLAAQNSEKSALSHVGYQSFICGLTLPLVWIINKIANLILKIGGKQIDVDDSLFFEDKVMSMLDMGQDSGAIKEEGRKMIDSIFEFDDLLAYEIMTPRTDVFTIDINDDRNEYFEELMELRHSRIPVYKDDPDNIVGILHIKDYLLNATRKGFDNVNIEKLLRPAYLVPETKNIDSLFKELQREKHHMSILIDEYGGFSGIVTVEDIIEQIVGDIDDEYDVEDRIIEKVDDDTFIVDGNVYLDDLDEETGVELESETSETIGGFIIDLMGEIPKEDVKYDPIIFGEYEFTILDVRDRRIEKIRIHVLEVEEDNEE